eukprot:6004003-Alexandrium_andersonii.AAC.1
MTPRGLPCPPNLLPRPVQRRFGSWNPGASGMSDQSPSARPAPGRDASVAGGRVATRGIR